MRFHAGFLVVALTGCASAPLDAESAEKAAHADESHVVFAALGCAYENARANANASQVSRLDDEVDRIRSMLREANTQPRPCSNPLIRHLAACISVSFERDEIVSAWRPGAECSSGDLARYK